MSRLALIRYAVLILVRDLITPLAGVYLVVHGLNAGTLQPWHLPLAAGMIGVPLVGRSSGPPPPGDESKDKS